MRERGRRRWVCFREEGTSVKGAGSGRGDGEVRSEVGGCGSGRGTVDIVVLYILGCVLRQRLRGCHFGVPLLPYL